MFPDKMTHPSYAGQKLVSPVCFVHSPNQGSGHIGGVIYTQPVMPRQKVRNGHMVRNPSIDATSLILLQSLILLFKWIDDNQAGVTMVTL